MIPPALRASLRDSLGVTEAEADTLLAEATMRNLAKGELWTHSGEVATEAALVVEGMMRHYYLTESGEATRWIALAGTFTGALGSLLRGEPSQENIAATERTTLLCFSFATFQAVKANSPRLQQFWLALMEQSYLGMEARVQALIALSAAERYAQMHRQFPEIMRQAPLQYVASMLGITPQHLSRLRAQR
jgi:CRP-like cAMP-binding protein